MREREREKERKRERERERIKEYERERERKRERKKNTYNDTNHFTAYTILLQKTLREARSNYLFLAF